MSNYTGNETVTLTLTRNEIAAVLSALSVSARDYRRDGAFTASKDDLALRIRIREAIKS